jgi:hypothetical protein
MVLVDQAGQLHVSNGYSSSSSHEKLPPWGLQEIRISWHGVALEDVAAIRFQTRQEEYAEFDDVPMDPK